MKRWLCVLLCLLMTSAALAEEYPEGTLYRGVKGQQEAVEFLQYQLFYGGYLGDDPAQVDGIYGPLTEKAVMAYQKDHGMNPDGIAWPAVRSMLDADWEAGMEPQGGAQPVRGCISTHYADGTAHVVLCPQHQQMYARAADALKAAEGHAMTVAALTANIAAWRAEMDSLYDAWAAASPEGQRMLIMNHKATFLAHHAACCALWDVQHGKNTAAALEPACTALADRCVEICCMLSESK